VNKLEFVKKINEQSLNRLSGLVIRSNSTRVPKKLNEPSLNIQYSVWLGSITALMSTSCPYMCVCEHVQACVYIYNMCAYIMPNISHIPKDSKLFLYIIF